MKVVEIFQKDFLGKVCGIYIIFNTVNFMVYIGQSKNIWYRVRKHKEQLIDKKHYNSHLQNFCNKYGIDLDLFHSMYDSYLI